MRTRTSVSKVPVVADSTPLTPGAFDQTIITGDVEVITDGFRIYNADHVVHAVQAVVPSPSKEELDEIEASEPCCSVLDFLEDAIAEEDDELAYIDPAFSESYEEKITLPYLGSKRVLAFHDLRHYPALTKKLNNLLEGTTACGCGKAFFETTGGDENEIIDRQN